MKVFAIADLHLSFNSNKPMSRFGSQWDNHEARIEEAWKRKIKEEDLVLIPGDISWAMYLKEAEPDLAWIEALPGQKICIKGNHDYWWDRPGKLNKGYKKIEFLQNRAILFDELGICGTRGWLSPTDESFTENDARLYERELCRLKLSLEDGMKKGAKRLWVMMHYPPSYNGERKTPFIELFKQYPVQRVIYGHLHDVLSWQCALKGVCEGIDYHLVSADYLNFEPEYIGGI